MFIKYVLQVVPNYIMSCFYYLRLYVRRLKVFLPIIGEGGLSLVVVYIGVRGRGCVTLKCGLGFSTVS